MIDNFHRTNQLPQYIFNKLAQLKAQSLSEGHDLIDFGMGNPDLPTPQHIVDVLVKESLKPENHRYSVTIGIEPLRQAISQWYHERFNVTIDPCKEAIVTMGSKEGIAHLALAMIAPGDVALVPTPSYPIHTFAFVIAGADVRPIALQANLSVFLQELTKAVECPTRRPKVIVLNFPANPTTQCVELGFFEEVIALAKRYGVYVLHDLAYAELGFDGYQPPSILQVKDAKDVAIESYTLSKTYNMAGWRVGFMCGNEKLVAALAKIKSYIDYGMFAPIQLAAVAALTGSQECLKTIKQTYQNRRDSLCQGLTECGWDFELPKASMFVWAKIPKMYEELGSFEFAKQLLLQADIAVLPGIGFGKEGDGYVRFGLVQKEERMATAIKNIKHMFSEQQLVMT